MDPLLLTFAVAAFLAVVLLLEGSYLMWSSHRGAEAMRLQARMRQISSAERGAARSALARERKLAHSPRLARVLAGLPLARPLERLLQQAGLERSVAGLLGLSALAALSGLLACSLTPAPFWIAPLCALGAAAVPLLHALHCRSRRLQAIERQLPDALDLMSRALRAGHAFPSALQMVGDEGPEPIAAEFRLTFDEINYGVPAQDALVKLARRAPIADLRFFVIAVAIQRETGGNLTELLDKLSFIVRARFKLLATVRVLSAEGRLSAWILGALPFVLVALINLINPGFMRILWTDPAGLVAIWASAGFMLAGLLWMWRITQLRV